jgi:transposase-like protein
VRTRWPQRAVAAVHQPREDWPAAYARVARRTGVPSEELRRTWLAWKRNEILIDRAEMLRAVEMLKDSEQDLADRIARDIRFANAQSHMADRGPRFLHYHTWVSLHSAGGFPDSVLVDRQERQGYIWELKRECALPRDDQIMWLDALSALGGRLEVLGTIRPSNEHLVRRALGIAA